MTQKKMRWLFTILVATVAIPLETDPSYAISIQYGNPLIERAYATDYPVPQGSLSPIFVLQPSTALPNGTLESFQTFNQANVGGSPYASAENLFHAYVLRPTGNSNEYSVVFDSGLLTVPNLPAGNATGRIETFTMTPFSIQDGDTIGFYGQGIPVDLAGTDIICYPSLSPPASGDTVTLGTSTFPIYPQGRTYSFGTVVASPVPEPATLLLFGAGLAGFAGTRIRKRKN